uniref:Sugar transporter SWEET1 n=1 Tax=Caenorhabditis japonica TaxID=281687 RepID=A0A8R1IPG8_CAEJA
MEIHYILDTRTFVHCNQYCQLWRTSVVLKTREVSTLPLPLCFVQFLVTLQWCIYGILVNDVFVVAPSATGMAISLIQLSLFVVFPKNSIEASPLERLTAWFTGKSLKMENEEKTGRIKCVESEMF